MRSLTLKGKILTGVFLAGAVIVILYAFHLDFPPSFLNIKPRPLRISNDLGEARRRDLHGTADTWNFSTEPQSISDFFRYIRWTVREACEISAEFGGKMFRRSGFTGKDGQKKLCLDRGIAPVPRSCLVFSFGINKDWSFDDDMAAYGCNVFAFDPSIDPKDHKRSARITFVKTGLGIINEDKDRHGWKMRTFNTLKRQLGHGKRVVDVLKMDIEGSEWAVLQQMVKEGALQQVKQLAVEIHMSAHKTVRDYNAEYWNVLRSVELQGFVKFAADPNPFTRTKIPGLDKLDTSYYELVWLNKNYMI